MVTRQKIPIEGTKENKKGIKPCHDQKTKQTKQKTTKQLMKHEGRQQATKHKRDKRTTR